MAQIREYDERDLERVVELSLSAWAPVFDSMHEVLGDEIFAVMYPNGWRTQQDHDVREVLGRLPTWVAEVDSVVAGFVSVDVESSKIEGEIVMIAVDPDRQGDGLGSDLFEHGVDQVRRAGLPIVTVGTGGDPGHAPARATYEKAGMTLMPIAQYFKLV